MCLVVGLFASTDRQRTTSTPLTSTLALALALTPALVGTSSSACPLCPSVATYIHPRKMNVILKISGNIRHLGSEAQSTELTSQFLTILFTPGTDIATVNKIKRFYCLIELHFTPKYNALAKSKIPPAKALNCPMCTISHKTLPSAASWPGQKNETRGLPIRKRSDMGMAAKSFSRDIGKQNETLEIEERSSKMGGGGDKKKKGKKERKKE
ncbi:hypothetical protein WN51_11431 [Melipona quadrifasciata]|uniref:Uncharacterized protein n=1 Tax=Melipona quadrifasciata TaxID=166423 RepID=A0A0M9A993_9HYME|nr:hypothetical protein WN51_11431 [Melipona quadrifasciata]